MNPAFGDAFVTGSEDNTIRMWSISKGALGESLTLPVQSVWSVACTSLGDIVAGSSDGVVRVFSNNVERIADEDALAAYEVAVQTRQTEQAKELGGVKVNDLPGPESLLQEGTEGQTRIVREPNGKVLCYQWSKGQWECVGDVMGASGGTKETSGKALYEGKEFDFVFNVDIEDGAPPLKLPFNKSDDPWLAAQKFIHKNDLPQVYLEQVANFIIKNANLTSLPAAVATQDFADPFTGEGRYIPTGNGSTSSAQAPAPAVNVNFRDRTNDSGAINVDPFTAGDSYSSGKKGFLVKKHIPCTTLITFDVYDTSKILAKLKEFNGQLSGDAQLSEDVIEKVVRLIQENDASSFEGLVQMVKRMPEEKMFPVLDVIRLVVRSEQTSQQTLPFIIDDIIKNLTSTPPNQLMSCRALSNVVAHNYGRNLVQERLNDIANQLSLISTGNVNLQIAVSSFFLNQSILQKTKPSNEVCTTLVIGTVRSLNWISDPESTFRSYQALGNLITFNSSAALPILKTVETLKEATERNRTAIYEKLAEISAELSDKLL